MATSEHIEIETTLEVDADTPVPDLSSAAGLAADPEVVHELSATYYDTPDLDLVRHKITLRRRTGGTDAGWHLKIPAPDREGRMEIRLPLSADGSPERPSDEAVPDELRRAVLGLVRRRPLEPVARVDNTRHLTVLRDASDTPRIEFCDDHVRTSTPVAGLTGGGDWREWEAEIVDPDAEGARDELAAVVARCVDAGGRTASSASKLARALGPLPAVDEGPGGPIRESLAADLDQLLAHDPGARAGTVTGVHQARVAVRGLRSTITGYAAELSEPARDAGVDLPFVAAELKMLAAILGRVRDVQVVGERLRELQREYSAEVVPPRVGRRIESELAAEQRRAADRVAAAMVGDRYLDLVEALHELVEVAGRADSQALGAAAPGRTGTGHEGKRDKQGGRTASTGQEVLLRGVDRQFARFDKARTRTERDLEKLDLTLAQREELTHVVRKRAKALRRGVGQLPRSGELSVTPLRTACQRLHTRLGDVQDSVTTRSWLRRIALRADADGESTFGFGVLYEHERGFSERTLEGFESDTATVTAAYRELEESRRAARRKKGSGTSATKKTGKKKAAKKK